MQRIEKAKVMEQQPERALEEGRDLEEPGPRASGE